MKILIEFGLAKRCKSLQFPNKSEIKYYLFLLISNSKVVAKSESEAFCPQIIPLDSWRLNLIRIGREIINSCCLFMDIYYCWSLGGWRLGEIQAYCFLQATAAPLLFSFSFSPIPFLKLKGGTPGPGRRVRTRGTWDKQEEGRTTVLVLY